MNKTFRIIPLLMLFFIAGNSFTQWLVAFNGNGTTKDINSVFSPGLSFIYAAGDSGYIRVATDGGSVWADRTINTTANLRCVYAFGSSIAYICGNQGVIYKTTNTGVNWTAINPAGTFNYYDMDFINSNTGLVVGQSRHFAYTVNGGTNWITGQLNVPGPANLDYTAAVFYDNMTTFVGSADTLISGGYVSYIHKSTNNGITYTQAWIVGFPGHCGITDIQFVNSVTGYALLQNGLVLKTTNGGSSWPYYNMGFTAKSICFVNDLTGYACGTGGQLKKTTNGGVNWLSQNSPGTTTMNDNHFFNASTGYSAGENGFIYRTSNGGTYTGINQTGNEIPVSFSLYQNYPNPFNPVTYLRFDIPDLRFVKLIIYNVLGGEVQTLVNEKLQAGTYEAEWAASNFPSGTYFYRLTAGDFVQTKKMILIK